MSYPSARSSTKSHRVPAGQRRCRPREPAMILVGVRGVVAGHGIAVRKLRRQRLFRRDLRQSLGWPTADADLSQWRWIPLASKAALRPCTASLMASASASR